ncbi:MAG: hypothetical protein EPO36_06950 [Chloroflexota bacterium]|nr:MAG: hypothetical protein EPO36_06950 [Chloroflexota bacterium]
MTRVYVDVEALSTGAGQRRTTDADAVRSLEYLAEAGHDVLLVTGESLPAALAELSLAVVPAAPPEPEQAAWYLTTDPERCRNRSARLRTVLVGRTPSPAAIHRCDALARDVLAAALEILAAEAMPSA